MNIPIDSQEKENQKSDFTDNVKAEEPLVIMRYKKQFIIIAQLAILLCYWFFSFGTIVPYVSTGDFAKIWPTDEGSVGRKAVFFYLSWIFWVYFPASIQLFRVGDVYFYRNYVELRPFLFFLKYRRILFGNMHVIARGNRGLALIDGDPGSVFKYPFHYWKLLYWNGICVTFVGIGLINPECIPNAKQIILKHAISTRNI